MQSLVFFMPLQINQAYFYANLSQRMHGGIYFCMIDISNGVIQGWSEDANIAFDAKGNRIPIKIILPSLNLFNFVDQSFDFILNPRIKKISSSLKSSKITTFII